MEETAKITLKENRDKKRAALLTEVRWQGQNAAEIGKTQNISESGLLLTSVRTLSVGSEVEVRFVLPISPDVVAVKATEKVAWERPGVTMGIQCLDLEKGCREAISRFVHRTQS